MNDSERAIEELRNIKVYLEDCKGDSQAIYIMWLKSFDIAIRELSRTRIRVTATEPPTREDADKRGLVMTYSHVSCFGYRGYKEVIKYPKMYLFWSCVPQLPEVTP